MCRSSLVGTRKGFTLVELAVVIVIIGVLAAFGVPQFLKSVERSKAAEAFNYLSAVRAAQERFLAKNGFYYSGTPDATTGVYPADATTGDTLDITQSIPKYFTVGAITESHTTGGATPSGTAGAPTWTCTLERKESSYGNYTVTFTQDGYDNSVTSPAIGAYSDINPMGA
jgi:prepilin-type N-terminal cleavage/methylation domain-containing protein